MNQQPDKLFREKLENYHKPVSANAWNRVENKLDKKNNKAFWLKIAASIIILAIAAVLLWPMKTNEGQPQLITKKPVEKKIQPQQNVSVPEKTTIAAPDTQEAKKSTVKSPAKKKLSIPKVETPARDITTSEIIVAEIQEEKISPVNDNAQSKLVETIAVDRPEIEKEEKAGITLIYTAEEIDEKYLDKKALAEATLDDKKPSTLRKLLDKAYDLKHNQDPFGDLRQKKNEILALNFKSEKQRSQNK